MEEKVAKDKVVDVDVNISVDPATAKGKAVDVNTLSLDTTIAVGAIANNNVKRKDSVIEDFQCSAVGREESLPIAHLDAAPSTYREPPVILLLVGSFSPITYMHLRLLELARDTAREHGRHVTGGYVSPTADAYGKHGLAHAVHRVQMARLALATLPWVAVDAWEARKSRFVFTYEVVERIKREVEGEVWIVCGGDLVISMAEMKKWSKESLKRLFRSAGVMWVGRGEGVDLQPLKALGGRFWEMKGVTWGLSSTDVRDCVKKRRSILFMTPEPVVDYIIEKRIYYV